MADVQETTYEAVCSVLYNLPQSEFLGEGLSEDDTEQLAWFHLGKHPLDMRVTVAQIDGNEGEIQVRVEWRDNTKRMNQVYRILTQGHSQHQIEPYVEKCVLSVLERFKAVISR